VTDSFVVPAAVTDWLMEGDPTIRWQVMRDLADAPPEEVTAERSLVASTGWGGRLLALQDESGQWGGGAYSPKWTSTTYTLLQLRNLGVDPDSQPMRVAAEKVRDLVTLGPRDEPFFSYRGETCITGMVLALGAYFRVDPAASDDVARWLLDEQVAEGGWNCRTARGSTRASFHTTISVLEGLAEYERLKGGASEITEARATGEEYLLQRRMFRSLSTGEVVNPKWTLFSFPPRWHYDVLRGLDHLRDAGREPDTRCEEAIDLVESKRDGAGKWPLQNIHAGKTHFSMETARTPSRWNTLRALRVLRWYTTPQVR
jgi:hypothetical protein